jgi:hypothetical protein
MADTVHELQRFYIAADYGAIEKLTQQNYFSWKQSMMVYLRSLLLPDKLRRRPRDYPIGGVCCRVFRRRVRLHRLPPSSLLPHWLRHGHLQPYLMLLLPSRLLLHLITMFPHLMPVEANVSSSHACRGHCFLISCLSRPLFCHAYRGQCFLISCLSRPLFPHLMPVEATVLSCLSRPLFTHLMPVEVTVSSSHAYGGHCFLISCLWRPLFLLPCLWRPSLDWVRGDARAPKPSETNGGHCFFFCHAYRGHCHISDILSAETGAETGAEPKAEKIRAVYDIADIRSYIVSAETGAEPKAEKTYCIAETGAEKKAEKTYSIRRDRRRDEGRKDILYRRDRRREEG